MRPPPTYRAFTVRKAKKEGKKDTWIAIGAAWPHRDEKGIDVVLDALPIDGHIALRLADQDNDTTSDRKPSERTTYRTKSPRTSERNGGQRWQRR
jgi:hypothetical protein